MATVVFVDQENGDFASTPLFKDLEQANSGKVFGSSGTVVKPRKALGNINKQVATAAPFQKGALKVKTSAPVTKQISKVCIKTSKQSYPEIEKCLPYNPADFETFVPEEHKLSHHDLSGVPLMHEHEASKFDALAHEPAPMDIPVISWESDISSALASFLAALDDFALDLPQMISEVCIKPSKQIYPEIEKCLPYDPADFETFDVPEEHKLSHLYLAGVPLIVHEKEAAKFHALLTREVAPMDIPVFSWESDMSCTLPSFMTTIDDLTLDLPQMVNC
ncbi:PREDICTED: LOW QUALITY PROTEIN: securin-like [Nanorana parkeri]|uniref:LOW QUALITY PROTEIN: securin-like n=1 Tax=Nanorana parkeri TaxID=125878 RepID=UPI0008548008|nr:PREDICTED: LOW QUALITY PROTEIN: securin-like [Nanorana parkeri]